MQFQSPLIEARLIKRYKRFLADVELETGDILTAHCANPGAMTGVNSAGSRIWLSKSADPKRKLPYSWEMIEVASGKKQELVGINTSHPNRLVEEAIGNGAIEELRGYQSLRREVKYGKNSRIDILLQDESKSDCYVEVKNVHLMRQHRIAEFPDSVTTRGAKHLQELADIVKTGGRGVMLFLIQRADATIMTLARDIDPAYGHALDEAQKVGVEILAYTCTLSTQKIEVATPVPFKANM